MRLFLVSVAVLMGIPSPGRSQQSESGALGVYADSLQGRATASGEPYDRGALTAAHAALPFGTVVRVANFQSGKMVDVRINDRKPRDSRILVISGAAARALDLSAHAIAPGAAMVLGQSPAPAPAPAAATAGLPAGNSPMERKFKPLAGLFGKATAPAGVATSAGAPLQDGIPGSQDAPPAAAPASSPFAFLGKSGNRLTGKPGVPAAAYPDAYPVSHSAPAAAAGGMTVPMNAVSGRVPVPQAVLPPVVPVAPNVAPAVAAAAGTALPPASPSAPYRVQFGSFRRFQAADELAGMLDGAGVPASVFAAPGTGMNVVVTDAGFRTAEEAQRWVDFEGARRGWTERPVVIR
jgi:rare lipoprotein A